MKLDKVKVESKTRALSAKYTVEQSVEIEHMMGAELQKAIDDEVMNQIVGPHLTDQGWYHVNVSNWEIISQEWLNENMNNEYKCYGYYWYFKSKTDATMFSLRWK